MVLQNYLILQPGVPARVHFVSHRIFIKTITDPETSRPKSVNALEFQMDELNGRPAIAAYSTISQKHANDFAPWLPGERYRDYDFIITVTGSGRQTEYQLQAIPRPKP